VSLLKLQRTIHAKLVLDRESKRDAVEREYWAWQRQLEGSNEALYSATRQQAKRLKSRVKQQNRHGLKRGKEYPMILRRDCVKVQCQKDSIFKWWIRIPVNPRSIWVPMHLPYDLEPLLAHDLRECKLLRVEDEWYVNITVQKQARLKRRYAEVLPVDMGIRKLATTIEQGKPCFYGKKIRTIRGHYFRLRRSAGKPRIVKQWRHIEQRSVRHEVHAITRRIVEHAVRANAIIAIGDMQGICHNDLGRRFNRRISGQPFYMFKQMLTYKANWAGIRVLTVPEAYTSQTCHRCGMRGQRVAGRFSCSNCGLICDADANGAWNIAKRAHGMLRHETGAALTPPITLAKCEP
jgi:IS605 OrfB family transposase